MNDSFRDLEERPGATVGGNVASTDLGTATAGVRVSGARKAFDRHVGICRDCRDYVDSYVRTIELEGATFADPDGPLPEDVPEELVHGILAARHAAG